MWTGAPGHRSNVTLRAWLPRPGKAHLSKSAAWFAHSTGRTFVAGRNFARARSGNKSGFKGLHARRP